MSIILLSIKEEYVKRILSGEKLFEFRKRIPHTSVERIEIYQTRPMKKIVASVEVKEILKDSPQNLWKTTKHASGIDYPAYLQYFSQSRDAYAYVLGTVTEYSEPIPLDEIGIQQPPQSFVILSSNQSDLLKSKRD